MKTVIMMAMVSVAIGVSVGMSGEVDGQKEPDAWGPLKGGCRLALKSSQSQYRFDQPIVLELTLKNHSKADVKTAITSMLTVYKFDVRLPNGKAAPLTLEGKRQTRVGGISAMRKTLKPGESLVERLPMLNRLHDMTLLGEYTVTASRVWVFPVGSDQEEVEVSSNTIKIAVTEDAASKPASAPETKPK